MGSTGGWLRVLAVVGVALFAGLVGYQIGISQNIVVEGGRAVGYPGWGLGWWFGGFFLFLLFMFLLFAAFRPRWGGPPSWSGRDWSSHDHAPPPFEEWHRRAHERGETRDVEQR
jgi:hypothetical protein